MPIIRWIHTLHHKQWISLFLFLAIFFAVLFFYGPTDNWSWDPSFYYAQLRSPLIDGDLDFRDETKTSGMNTPVTVTGLQGSPWPIGPSILWSPFFLVAHLFVLVVNPAKATGFSSPYIALVSFGSALYGLAGLFVVYRICRIWADKFLSILTILLCLAASPLFYYIFHQTFMAHSTGFLVASLMFLYYVRLTLDQTDRKWSGFAFGVLLGLNFLTRWSGLLFAIFPNTYFFSRLIAAVRSKDKPEQRFIAIQMLVAVISFSLTISPQLALWQRLYGNFLVFPQGAEAFVGGILPINLFNILFHTNRGLLFWCPFVLVGMVGIFRIPNPAIRYSSALCVLSQVIIIGYRRDWFSGGGFGARYFIELLPLLAVGFISLAQGLSTKPAGRIGLVSLAFTLVLHQSILMYAVEHTENRWLDIEAYLKGRPLGLRWQIDSLVRLVKNPGIWLEPRSFISEKRQSIIINLIAGVRDYRAYVISASAAILTPFATLAGLWVYKYKDKLKLPAILWVVMVWMVAWSVFLLLVG